MSQLQLKDGSFREFTPGQSAAEIVKEIGMGLYKAACCVKINGEAVPAKEYNVDPAKLEGAVIQVGKRKFAKLV